ncbi:MAG: hypothetical protein U0002_06040 [Thermoanaerobaculia bacterium]
MRVAFFTAGTVGGGHLVHGLALGRGLARAGFAGSYRMFGPALPFSFAQGRADYQAVEIQRDGALRRPETAAGSELACALRSFEPDLLVVDLFWAPLRWILPALGCEAWLLVRICPQDWLSSRLGMPFAPEQFARIVAMEPIEHPLVEEWVEPLVIANREDCHPPGALRERLGVAAGEVLQVVLHAGLPGEVEQLGWLAEQERPRVLDLYQQEVLFPAAEWLGDVDRLITGAGYNSFWEAHWLGWAPRTHFVPFVRSIDDQAARIELFSGYRPEANGADQLARQILELQSS